MRPLVSTLEAQLAASTRRLHDGRPRTQLALGRATSALPFVPVLGAWHGLGTGRESLYRLVSFHVIHVSFHVIHVWKLGAYRQCWRPPVRTGRPYWGKCRRR